METQLKMVELLPHDGGWKHAFKIERDIILSVIDKNVLGVEHVGSTSVVNIKAKAIVDIVVGLDSLKNGHIYIKALSNIGYVYKGSMGKSKRYYFYKIVDNKEKFHLHLVEYEDQNWSNLVQFRDILVNNNDVADRYNILKAKLEKKYFNNRETYTNLKGNFIKEVLKNSKRKTIE